MENEPTLRTDGDAQYLENSKIQFSTAPVAGMGVVGVGTCYLGTDEGPVVLISVLPRHARIMAQMLLDAADKAETPAG